jgi:hypothetical protein
MQWLMDGGIAENALRLTFMLSGANELIIRSLPNVTACPGVWVVRPGARREKRHILPKKPLLLT